jgi:hypothetical protein
MGMYHLESLNGMFAIFLVVSEPIYVYLNNELVVSSSNIGFLEPVGFIILSNPFLPCSIRFVLFKEAICCIISLAIESSNSDIASAKFSASSLPNVSIFKLIILYLKPLKVKKPLVVIILIHH